MGFKRPQSRSWAGRQRVRHGWKGGHGLKPDSVALPCGSASPEPTLEARGHEIHGNLHIRLVPQDTGLVGGALGESREESGSQGHLTGPREGHCQGPPTGMLGGRSDSAMAPGDGV